MAQEKIVIAKNVKANGIKTIKTHKLLKILELPSKYTPLRIGSKTRQAIGTERMLIKTIITKYSSKNGLRTTYKQEGQLKRLLISLLSWKQKGI